MTKKIKVELIGLMISVLGIVYFKYSNLPIFFGLIFLVIGFDFFVNTNHYIDENDNFKYFRINK